MLNQKKRWARMPWTMALWALGMVVLGPSAQAGFIDFNPTGSSSSSPITIGGIDVAPGSALAVNSLPLAVGKTFQLVYQASVSGLINTNGLTIAPPGLMSTYQLTAVASFTEVVTSLNSSGTLATFTLAPTQSPNSFFEMYYNPAVVVNNLAGTGFNAGTLILAGTPATTAASVGLFSLSTDTSGQPIAQAFDQYVANHYPGVATVVGSGSALLLSDVTYFNPAFFLTPVSRLSFNSSLVTPFNQVSPSGQFTSLPGGGAPNVTPDIGTINGSNGKDFQFQADANLAFTPSVPEPASIIQAGLGLLGALGLAALMRR